MFAWCEEHRNDDKPRRGLRGDFKNFNSPLHHTPSGIVGELSYDHDGSQGKGNGLSF